MSNSILFTITGLAMGGAENQVVNLADELARRGHKVVLAYMVEPTLVLPCSDKVNVVWLGGSKSIFGMARAFINLIKLLRHLNPDVVHSHMFHANIISRLACVVRSAPRLVCTAHSNNEGGRLRMLAYRLTDGLAHVFTNVSAEAVTAFELKRAAPVGRMQTVHNGINTERFVFNQEARDQLRSQLFLGDLKVFIAIGRFHEAKDYPNLISAFKRLSEINKNTHLLIVGDGEQRSKLEHQINDLGLKSMVTLLGIRKDVPELLSASDVFVLSSAWEGFGLVVAEAMAVQRIVIATDAGGVAEVLGETGYLVEPRRSSALANAMQQVMHLDGTEAELLGQLSRERVVSHYSMKAAVDRWEEVYTEA